MRATATATANPHPQKTCETMKNSTTTYLTKSNPRRHPQHLREAAYCGAQMESESLTEPLAGGGGGDGNTRGSVGSPMAAPRTAMEDAAALPASVSATPLHYYVATY
ncbi:hypothetical protein M758_8G087900 [Ceratodon purpureus]|uniref:Uncharacterized protein n=1 Tax=Ceratodon purpureus TaxID=3225 RepID=A0A8T0GZC1_CERPU|nr:hypothetical protein KC19_8G092500 [Ceratodon purpureus]KAG0608212.1 hypothetical protein M758_8G087900 [Ceratodon purpureus]